MSYYTAFGFIPDQTLIGPQGPPGVGFALTGSDYDMVNKKLRNVADPIIAQDAATKNYIDTNFPTTGGSASFASAVLTNTTNQLTLGTTNTVTINSTAPAASRTYTIPDSGTNSQIVLTDGTQSLSSKNIDETCAITKSGDTTAKLVFNLTNNNAGEVTTITANGNYTISLPSATTTLVGTDTANSLSNKAFVDPSDSTKALTFNLVSKSSGITQLVFGGGANNITFPSSTATLSTLALSETLSNKTLTSCASITFSSGNQTALTKYYEGTHSSTFSGPFTSGTIQLTLVRVGKIVVCYIPPITGTSTTSDYLRMDTALPADFRPGQFVQTPFRVTNNSATDVVGLIYVSSGGALNIYADIDAGNFASTGTVGLKGQAQLCWLTA